MKKVFIEADTAHVSETPLELDTYLSVYDSEDVDARISELVACLRSMRRAAVEHYGEHSAPVKHLDTIVLANS
jgi:hypothetical protein